MGGRHRTRLGRRAHREEATHRPRAHPGVAEPRGRLPSARHPSAPSVHGAIAGSRD
jgi:hypothetical protein